MVYGVILFAPLMSWLYLDFMFYFFALFADGTLAQSATIVGEGTFHDRVHTAAQRHERQSNGKKESAAQTTDIYTDIYKYINIYTAYFICHLIVCSGFAQESCIEFERLVHAQCEALIQAIHDRREYLLEAIRNDKDTKIRILKVCTRPQQLLSSSCLTVFFSFLLYRINNRTARANCSRQRV